MADLSYSDRLAAMEAARANLANISNKASTPQMRRDIIQSTTPDGYREMTGAEKLFSRIGDIGNTIIGMSGFGENYAKAKEDFANGTLDAGQALKTAGSFLVNIPLGMISAPFSGAQNLYEAATGTPIAEHQGDYIPDYELSADQRAAAGLYGGIDIGGLFLGGTGGMLRAGKAAMKGADLVTAVKAGRAAVGKTAGGRVAYQAGEEGAEEFVQSYAEDVRGTKEEHGVNDDSLSKAVESAVLGALGGAIMGGAIEGISALKNKNGGQTDPKTTEDLPQQPEKKVEAGTFGSRVGDDVIVGVQDEMLKEKAIAKDNPSSAAGRGIFDRNGRLRGPDHLIMGYGRLYAILAQENSVAGQNQNHAFTDWLSPVQIPVNGRNLTVYQAFQEAERTLQENPQQAQAIIDQIKTAVNTHCNTNSQNLELYLSKPPGDKIGFVRVYLQGIEDGDNYSIANVLGVALNADTDGDNYQIFAQKPEGRPGRIAGASLWQTLVTYGQDYKKQGYQAHMVKKTPDTKAAFSELYDNIIDTTKLSDLSGISNKTEFMHLIDLLYDQQFGTPAEVDKAKTEIGTMTKKAQGYFPGSIFEIFTIAYNTSKQDTNTTEAALDKCWTLITTKKNYDPITEAGARLEQGTNGTIRNNASELINAKIQSDKTSEQFKKAKKEEAIFPVEMGDPSNRNSFLSAVVDLFQPSRSVFATPTRLNLVTMFQLKSIAEEVYESAVTTGKPWTQSTGLETFLNRLMQEDSDIAALGLHPMEQTTAVLKQAAYRSAEIDYTKRTGKNVDFNHADDFIENEFKKSWEKAKNKWDRICQETYNGFTFDGMETVKFPEFSSENAYVLLYDAVQDKTIGEFFGGTNLGQSQSSVLISEAVSTIYKSKSFGDNIYPPDVMQTLTKMAEAIRAKAVKDQTRITEALQNSCALNKKNLDAIAAMGYDLDAFIKSQKQTGNIAYRQVAQHIQGLYGVTRAGDMRSSGWFTVNQIFRAAQNGDIVAQKFLSGDVNEVKHAVVILAFRGQFAPNVNGETKGVLGTLYKMRNDKTTRGTLVDEFNIELGKVLDTSPLYNQICLMLNELNEKGLSDELIEQKITTLEALIDPKKSFEEKQNRITAAEPRNADKARETFFVDAITKISESDDMQTPQSRFLQYSRFFNESSLISQVPKNAELVSEWVGRPENSGRIDNIVNNLGLLYETNWLENVQQSMVVSLANQSIYSQYRARKTNTPASDATIWSAFTRAGASGAVTSEFGNMAFMSSSYNWNDVMGNPSLLGKFLFTNFLEEIAGENTNGKPNLVKIVLSDGTPVYVKDKVDFARLLVPEDVRNSLFSGRTTWSASDLQTLLQYQPVLSEVFNPISYTTQEINGQAVIKPSHRFTFDENESSIFRFLEKPTASQELEAQRTDAKILQSVLKDRDGMLLLYSLIDDSVFENPGDFQATRAAVNKATKDITLFWKRYLMGDEKTRQEMLSEATGKAYYDRAKVLANQWNAEILTQNANAAFDNMKFLGNVEGALLEGIVTNNPKAITSNALTFVRNVFGDFLNLIGQGSSKEKINKVMLLQRISQMDSSKYQSTKFKDIIDALEKNKNDNNAKLALDVIRYFDFAISLIDDTTARDNIATAVLSTIAANSRGSMSNKVKTLVQAAGVNTNIFSNGNLKTQFLKINTQPDQATSDFLSAIDLIDDDANHDKFLDAIEQNVKNVAERLGVAEEETSTTAYWLAGEAGKKPGNALIKAFNGLRKAGQSTKQERVKFLKSVVAPYASFDEDQAIFDQATIDASFAKVSDRLTKEVSSIGAMTMEELDAYDKAKPNMKFSVINDKKRMGLEQVLGEIVAGNVNDGVSMNARERNYLIPFIDYSTTMQASNTFSEQGASPATAMWTPEFFDSTQKVVQYYKSLGEDNWKISGTYMENGQLKQLNPAIVEKWMVTGISKPIQAAYFISMPNAGFDARFRLPSPNANGTQNSFLYALDQILIDCSEALNLLSKKKGDQYAAISYGLDNQAGRRSVQEKSYGKIKSFTDLVTMVAETKDAYVKACVEAYQSDTAHQSIKVTAKNFYDLVNHQVQRIFTFDQQGNQTIFAWNDLLDQQSEQRRMFEQMLASGQIRNAKIDIMTITELGAEIGRARPEAAAARGYSINPNPKDVDSTTQNQRMQEIFADQVYTMRHRNYQDPYAQIGKDLVKVSGVTFGTNRFRTDSAFGQNINEVANKGFNFDESRQIQKESSDYFKKAHNIKNVTVPLVYDLSPASNFQIPSILTNAFRSIERGERSSTIDNEKACIFLETTNASNAESLVEQAIRYARDYDLRIAVRTNDTVATETFRNKVGLASYATAKDADSGLLIIRFTHDYKNSNSTVKPEFNTLKNHPRILQLFSSAVPAGDGMVRINSKAAQTAVDYQKSTNGKLAPGVNWIMLSPKEAAETNIDFRTQLVTDQIALGLKSKDYSSNDIIQAVRVFKKAASNVKEAGQGVSIKAGHIVCAGIAKQSTGGKVIYKPILIETSGNPSYETIDMVYSDSFQTINYHVNYKSGGQYKLGDAQKFFFDGIKGMCVQDKMADGFSLGGDIGKNIGIAVLDYGNNGGKYSSDEYNIAEKYYFWAKDHNLSMFYEPDNNGGFKLKEGIDCSKAPEAQEWFFDKGKENDILQAIVDGRITFKHPNPQYSERLTKIMQNIARTCYGKGNFFEHFSAFMVNSDKKTVRSMNDWYSSVMAAFPDTMMYDDFAVLYSFISPETFSMEHSATLLSNYSRDPNTYLPRFSRSGDILVFNDNHHPMYEACAYGAYVNDFTSSSSDAFFGQSKIGEKPMTTTLFGIGQDPSADYTNLRVESDMVLGLGLENVSEYYKQHKQVREKTDPKQAAFLNRVGLKTLAGRENYEEATQYLYSIHTYNLKEITDQYYKQHITILDGKTEKSIQSDPECRNLIDAIKSKFREDAPIEPSKWDDIIEGVVKKYLGWSPNVAGKTDGQMSFTQLEIRTALQKALHSLDNGVFFDIAEGGIENYSLYSSGRKYTRYIIPYHSKDEIALLAYLKNNARDVSTLNSLNQTKMESFVKALNTARTNSMQKTALLTLADAFATESDLKLDTGHVRDRYYLSDLLRQGEEILRYSTEYKDVSKLKEISDANRKIYGKEIEYGIRRDQITIANQYGEGGLKAYDVSHVDTTITKLANQLCEVNKMMRVLNPLLMPASILERLGYTAPSRYLLANGIQTGHGVFSSNLKNLISDEAAKQIVPTIRNIASGNQIRKVFGDFKIANTFATTSWAMESIDSVQDVSTFIKEHANETALQRIANAEFDFMTGRGIGQKMQIEVFFLDLIRRVSLDERLSAYMRPTNGGDSFVLLDEINREGVEKFFLKCFAVDSPLRGVAGQAMNLAMRGDAAQKTVFSTIFNEYTNQHEGFKFFSNTLFSPFMQYGWNITSRHLNCILPMSTLNYVLCELGSGYGIPLPGLRGYDEKTGATRMATTQDLNLQDAKIAATIREALLLDLSHMGATFTAALLIAMAGGIEPPEDEDKWCNVEEWTFFGNRIQENWWIQDLLGPTLAYAVTVKSTMMGKPSPETFVKNMSDLMYANPLMKFSDVFDWIMNPYGKYMESYYQDVERYSENMDGEQTALQVLGDNIGVSSLEYIFQFITPSIVKEIYKNSQIFEASYKNIYTTDKYGERDDGTVQKATHFDQRLRLACRNNPFLALFADLVTNNGENSGGTGYLATQMPRTVYYDPEQIDSLKALSFYNDDGSRKSASECDAITVGALCKLLAYDSMEDLQATGFAMPRETMVAVGDMIWDIVWDQKCAFDEILDSNTLDPYIVGDGDIEEGRKIIEQLQASYDNTYNFWTDVYYNKLYSPEMKQGAVGYNRLSTGYAQDANGNWYATGFTKTIPNMMLPFKLASGTISNPGPTAGWGEEWATPSAVTGEAMYDDNGNPMRVLVPVDEEYFRTPDFDELGGNGDGTGYSKTTKSRGGSGGYGGGYSSRGGFVQAPNVYLPSTRGTTMPNVARQDSGTTPVRGIDLTLSYLRPQFETKGSRQAYRREDI